MKNLKFYSLATGAALAMGATPTQAATPRADKPNVIMILIDDLSSFGVSAYGLESITSSQKHFTDEKLSTPNIDKLAQEGVLCSHAYSHALSEATRVALMTGMNNGRNYIETKALHESQITYGDVFQANGYKTAVYGKWKQSRGSIEVPAVRHISAFGWDDYSCFDMVYANQRFINPDLVVNDKIENYNGRTDLDPATDRRWYGPDMFNRKTLEFIEKNQNDPFFIYYSLVLIHDDHKPTPDSKPRSVFDTTDESNKNDLREYFPDMIRYTDKMIGRVVDKVEELGLRDNTIIIVMGDNGSKEFVTF
ncbi:MAG: sulfatase-like hydrolase/transferase, partial [Rikenellaceae bacterium]